MRVFVAFVRNGRLILRCSCHKCATSFKGDLFLARRIRTDSSTRLGDDVGGYFVTFSVTVLEVAVPFLGVTVTVTLHDPTFKPFSVVPATRQIAAVLGDTFSNTFAPVGTAIPAYQATTAGLAEIFRVNFGAKALPDTLTVRQRVQFPAESLTRTLIVVKDKLFAVGTDIELIEEVDTTSPRLARGTETSVA